MVDLCLCFLSLRREESGEGEARGDGLRVLWYGGSLSGEGEGAGRRVALSSETERRDCLKIETETV
jgi:hypothetical protein